MTEGEFKKNILPIASKVYPMALRLSGNRDAALDAVQQGMMKLWEKRKQLESCQNIVAFIFTIVRNICLDEIKKKRPIFVDDLTQVNSSDTEYQWENDHVEAARLINKIIDALPVNQREVILLRDIEGFEFEEIAEILKIEVTYARVLLSRARKQVREKLEKWYAYESI